MRCYLKPLAFKVLSFDLDDTLYDNLPHIHRAEAAFLAFMQQNFNAEHGWHSAFWYQTKMHLVQSTPALQHDIGLLRWRTVEYLLQQLGLTANEARVGADAGLDCFLHHRSDFTVSDEVISLLNQLGERFTLIGITNGNVDACRIGLTPVLDFVLHPGNGVKMKPAPDLFIKAQQLLDVSPSQILHIGDSFKADVVGARRAGCQSAWLNPSFGRYYAEDSGEDVLGLPKIHAPLSHQLPHFELELLFELQHLL